VLKKDYEFFIAHRDEYLRDHRDEYAVIENESLLGFYPNQMSAMLAMKEHVVGNFLVKKVVPADQDIVEYHTQAVAFV
jgi:hypothetical protein